VSAAWVTIIALALITFVIKAAGPVLLAGKRLPAPVMGVVALLAPALLAALVAVETFSEEKDLVLDPRALGVGAAALALALRASMLVTVGVAALVTAGVRALTGA
jgi:branched-subunit amino acid transport protein